MPVTSGLPAAAPVAEVADGVFQVQTPLGDRVSHLYLVRGSDATLLLDTGVRGTVPAFLLPALALLGIDTGQVGHVVVSHCDVDHFGGLADVRAHLPRARVRAHAADRPLMEHYERYVQERAAAFTDDWGWHEDPAVLDWCREVTGEAGLDGDLAEGEVIELGDRSVVVRHVPGHSRGHLAVEVPAVDAWLVSDAVLGATVPLADGTPAFPPTYRYVDDYLDTVARLQHAAPSLLLTAHYADRSGAEVMAFLDESLAFVHHLETLLEDAFAPGEPLALADVLLNVNERAGAWPSEGTAGALAFPVVGHLERWREDGRLVPAGTRDGLPLWVLG